MVVMNTPILSAAWHRVADLRPRLRSGVTVQRQRHRNQTWYRLTSPLSGRRHRVNAAAYRFIGRLDGRRTVGEAWEALVEDCGDAALSQDDTIRVLGQLNAAELVQCERTPDLEQLFRQYRARARRRRWLEMNPLAIRVRLFDPSRVLSAFDSGLPRLFSPGALVVWICTVLPAALLAAIHWTGLQAYAASHLDTPRYLLLGWLVYPFMKALHELGHALAVRRWGGEVHDVGFTLFVLVPVPYVDASAASGFPRRARRATVSAIGILIEIFIAALAFYAWLNVENGLVRDIAFVAMLIGAVSTVLFNGNPLLRFDGYHVLCDILDLPNLDTRSRAFWRHAVERRLLGLDGPHFETAAGERKWLVAYAPLAWLYRLYVGFLIVLWVAAKSAAAAILIAVTLAGMLLIAPAVALVRDVLNHPQASDRSRAKGILAAATLGSALAIALAPMPYGAVAPAVIWLPERAQVRAETDGFVQRLAVRDGEPVKAGEVLVVLDDPALLASQAEARARLLALRVRQYQAFNADRAQAPSLAQAISHAEAELARIDARIAQLEIRSAASGRVVFVRPEDLPGSFVKKGDAVAYVLQGEEAIVRAAAAESDAALIRERLVGAVVWLEEMPGATMTAKVRRDFPAATFRLPSPALADRNGGSIVTDVADSEHLRTLEPVLLIDVALPRGAVRRIGGRAWVRFDFGRAPLAVQWSQSIRQLLLRHFEGVV
jgi:putative peptide zinc metalloprotease protein